MIRPLTSFDSNKDPAYKTHKPTTSVGGIGIGTPPPHISPIGTAQKMVNVNVNHIKDWRTDYSIDVILDPNVVARMAPENFSPMGVWQK